MPIINRSPEREAQPESDKKRLRKQARYRRHFFGLGRSPDRRARLQGGNFSFEQGRGIIEAYATADQKDIRAQHALSVALTEEALVCVDMLDPELNRSTREIQRENATRAIELLSRSITIQEQNLVVSGKSDQPKVDCLSGLQQNRS